MTRKRLSAPCRLQQPRRPRISLNDEAAWDAIVDELSEELSTKPRGRKGLSPYHSRSGTIRRFVYELVGKLKSRQKLRIIKSIVNAYADAPTKVKLEDNPYYWTMYAIRASSEIDMTDKEISGYAIQMRYAEANWVSTEFLIGFLYQQGNHHELARKLRDGELEIPATYASLSAI